MAGNIPDTMAVYKNKYVTDGAGVPLEPLSKDEMMELGSPVADLLGEHVIEVDYRDGNHLDISCEKINISVSGDGHVRVEFNESFQLPMEIDGSRKSYLAALNYISKELKPLLELCGIDDPMPIIHHDYTFDGERHYDCNLADADNSNSVSLYLPDGFLNSISWDSYMWSSGEVLGEYPTIPYEEAKELLLAGQWSSFVLLKNFATFIVPAIEKEHLKDFPEIVVYFN